MLPIELQLIKYIFFEKPIYQYKMKQYYDISEYKQLKKKLNNYKPNPSLKTSPLENTKYTIFDLETTGLIPEVGHEIISIGAIQIQGLKHCRVKRFYKIIRPIRPFPKSIEELTGIEHSDIKHAQPFVYIFKQFMEFSKNSILVAHPAKFDMRFLQTMLKRWKLPVYEPYVIDSQLMVKWLFPGINYQLDPLIHYFNIEKLERHHALNDAIMTAEIFEELLRQTLNKQIHTFEELQQTLIPYQSNYFRKTELQYRKDWS